MDIGRIFIWGVIAVSEYKNRSIKESEMFNQMSEYYDKYRPNYPDEIIKTIIDKANLCSGSKLLEIGCGSGKATEQFAHRDFEILAIDPGEDLISRAKSRFNDGNINFVNSRFENYNFPNHYFDAIISAQAFHWLQRPKCYDLCADALNSKAWLMPFWNIELVGETELDFELYKIIERYDAYTSTMKKRDYENRVESISNEIEQSGKFSKPKVIQVYWDKTYTAEEYLGFCMTGQFFVQNSDKDKRSCYDDLKELCNKYDGIKRIYVCELYASQKIK